MKKNRRRSRKGLISRTEETRYSKSSFLIHGKFTTSKWDFEHHVVPPMSSSSTFRLESAERGAAGFRDYLSPASSADKRLPIYIYDRLDEPTRAMLEERLAYAEGGETAICFASGMAAISAALGIVVHKDCEIIAHRTLYGCTYSFMQNWLPKYGVTVNYVDLTDISALKRVLSKRVTAVYLESPVNPTLELIDIKAVSDVVHKYNKKIAVIVDNTFATPFCQRPLELGADMSAHSLTKNICGFGTDMGGAVITSKKFEGELMLYRKDFGGVLSPKNAWTILVYGLPSLDLRLRREETSARQVAKFLENHPKIGKVVYPGLESFPQRDLAHRQMTDFDGNFAPGSMIYFTLKGRPQYADAAGSRLINCIAKKAYTITVAVSLGQIRTLIEKPSSMTHSAIPVESQRAAAIDAGGIRLSIGIEDPDDIINDIRLALDALK